MSGNNWNTHYFGRFQLSLPPGSEIVADYKIFDENLELVSKNGKSQLPVITQRLIEDLEKGVARGTSSKYEKPFSSTMEASFCFHASAHYTP